MWVRENERIVSAVDQVRMALEAEKEACPRYYPPRGGMPEDASSCTCPKCATARAGLQSAGWTLSRVLASAEYWHPRSRSVLDQCPPSPRCSSEPPMQVTSVHVPDGRGGTHYTSCGPMAVEGQAKFHTATAKLRCHKPLSPKDACTFIKQRVRCCPEDASDSDVERLGRGFNVRSCKVHGERIFKWTSRGWVEAGDGSESGSDTGTSGADGSRRGRKRRRSRADGGGLGAGSGMPGVPYQAQCAHIVEDDEVLHK